MALDTHQIPSCYDPSQGVVFNSGCSKFESKQAEAIQLRDWGEYAISELQSWLATSSDLNKTVMLWSEAYIQCGSCKLAWDSWLADNPIDKYTGDIQGWINRATEQITKNGWV